jgi:methionyl-tRNA formyltransferase
MKDNNIKIVFMGTPDFSVEVLTGLIENYNVVAVVTQPDKQVGREGKIKMSPVKECAIKHNIDVLQPIKMRKEFQMVLDYEPDMIVTCAYGQILPKEIIDYPKHKCINVHASLLPKYRGGAPIHHSIIAGDKKTGITVMHMDYGMDNGNILTQREVEITNIDTAETLFGKLKIVGRELLLDTLPKILNNEISPQIQNEEEVTYAYNIKPEDEVVNFSKKTIDVYNQIRGLNSWPVAYTMLDNKRIKVWESIISDDKISGTPGKIISLDNNGIGVETLDGLIYLTVIQPEGKKRMLSKDYINGIKKEEWLGKILK